MSHMMTMNIKKMPSKKYFEAEITFKEVILEPFNVEEIMKDMRLSENFSYKLPPTAPRCPGRTRKARNFSV